jgi:1,4-alpha-glucan branching enzyme
MMYFYDENFMLPLSHDEVVHGKSPMIYKMPGDEWQKFANLRLLYTYMFMHPGAKLLFMGNEFGQTDEWNYKTALRWDLLSFDCHKGLQKCVATLSKLVKSAPALHETQFVSEGFRWADLSHREESVVAFSRHSKKSEDHLLVILNMTPVVRQGWKIQVGDSSEWEEIFNSDSSEFWGTGQFINSKRIISIPDTKKSENHYITVDLPPLGGIVLRKINT